MIDIYSSGPSRYSIVEKVRETRTLVHCPSAENLDVGGDARPADICATSRCGMTDLDDRKNCRFFDFNGRYPRGASDDPK